VRHDLQEHWIPPSEKERLHRNYDLGDFYFLAAQVQFLIQHLRRAPHSIRVFDFEGSASSQIKVSCRRS
jgi:hypothetical protein